jgi:glutathione synthase/RimK-type ligase-like ATP-grasp enzyme
VKPVVAFVSARAARGLDEDLPPFAAALQAAGVRMEVVDWDDPTVQWESFDLALLRSTWDYTERLREFLVWVDATARRTTVLNPPAVVRWNTDKHYLRELARAAVPVVPSTFVEPGDNAERALDSFLARHDGPEFVVKPSVSANARDTERHARTRVEPAVAQARRLLDAERSVLLQPYLDSVDRDGETSLIYFAGKFSHAIRKAPVLPSGVAGSPAIGLVFPERITPRVPGEDELRVAEKALAALPSETPLYARIDLIRDADGAPTLLELELTEPSLFLVHAPGAAERFATAVLEVASAL